MGKLCKKLVVYLDQNFISDMAKAPTNARVNPQFTAVYDLLHRGFIDEKVVVPMSFFHDLETSLAPELVERFRDYQGHLGQIHLRLRDEIEVRALDRAVSAFLGETLEPLDCEIAFHDDPDQRLERFTVRANLQLTNLNIMQERQAVLAGLEQNRRNALASGRAYRDQVQLEIDVHAQNILQLHPWIRRRLSEAGQLAAFVRSEHFRNVSTISIFARMWSKLFIDYAARPLRASDDADVKLISAYLPHVDVLGTDTFMAALARDLRLDVEYDTSVFGSNKTGLSALEGYLSDYLPNARPANWPELSIFVLSDDAIKQDSWEFFRQLGNSADAAGDDESGWIEVFGFDDGNMPTNAGFGFAGLQDVTSIPLPPGASRGDVLRLCRERSRATKFVLIETRITFPPGFARQLIAAVLAGAQHACGFTIYSTV